VNGFEICPLCRGLCGKLSPDMKTFHPCLMCGGNGCIAKQVLPDCKPVKALGGDK